MEIIAIFSYELCAILANDTQFYSLIVMRLRRKNLQDYKKEHHNRENLLCNCRAPKMLKVQSLL